eukprot:CAMPEP_0172665370 /NCGR_PEP_ID=MMETSP1074-20121228/7211_1 /TAXON_ID=2916 /ORGANISM="Ceratium fusus, Strain PA161109" /LENGTH=54 /DNA_ID=CAMNT_0013481677 /DNA_START=54 /DNA_END=215 /DNA_ORIENTATION=+
MHHYSPVGGGGAYGGYSPLPPSYGGGIGYGGGVGEGTTYAVGGLAGMGNDGSGG